MNFYTLAAREEKEFSKMMNTYEACNMDKETAKQLAENILDNRFDRTYRRAVKRMLMAREINEELGLSKPNTNRMFFITIRPKCDSITFTEFYKLIKKLLERKCFSDYYVTFEQKGTSDESLGQGFHTHIITCATQRGKAEVLRDVYSTVKDCTEKHCIQIDITYNGQNMFNNYCIEYESKDGHKIKTKEWDSKWRSNIGIADYYQNELPTISVPAIKSEAGTYIIEII